MAGFESERKLSQDRGAPPRRCASRRLLRCSPPAALFPGLARVCCALRHSAPAAAAAAASATAPPSAVTMLLPVLPSHSLPPPPSGHASRASRCCQPAATCRQPSMQPVALQLCCSPAAAAAPALPVWPCQGAGRGCSCSSWQPRLLARLSPPLLAGRWASPQELQLCRVAAIHSASPPRSAAGLAQAFPCLRAARSSFTPTSCKRLPS